MIALVATNIDRAITNMSSVNVPALAPATIARGYALNMNAGSNRSSTRTPFNAADLHSRSASLGPIRHTMGLRAEMDTNLRLGALILCTVALVVAATALASDALQSPAVGVDDANISRLRT